MKKRFQTYCMWVRDNKKNILALILMIVTVFLIVNYCIDFYYKRTSTTENGQRRYMLFASILVIYLFSSAFWLFAKSFFHKHLKLSKRVYTGMLIMSPFVMVALTELSTNKEFLHMQVQYILLNALIAAVFYFLLLAVCPKTKTAVQISFSLAFAIGIVNYYVMTYRVHPIMFSDIYSLDTAAMVIGGYHYSLANRIMLAISLYDISMTMIGASYYKLSVKESEVSRKKAVSIAARIGLCATVLLSFISWINFVDFSKAYVKKINYFDEKTEASSGSVGRNESLIWQQDRDI